MNNKRLRALSLLLCLALVLPMLPIPASGALDATVSIESVEEFLAIMDDPDGSYRLDADLDLGNVLPLGCDPATGQLTAFTGSLDGNGHTLYYSLENREEYPNAHTCGLFAYLDGAEIFNLNVKADLLISRGCTAGLIAARADDSTFGGVTIDGTIRVRKSEGTNGASITAAGICPNASGGYYNNGCAAAACTVDLEVDAQLDPDDSLRYYGLLNVDRSWGSSIHSSTLSGSILVEGGYPNLQLLCGAYDSFCDQSVTILKPRNLKLTGLSDCDRCYLSGSYHTALTPSSYGCEMTGLVGSRDCMFLGSISLSGSGSDTYCIGAKGCERCTVECPMTANVPGCTVYFDGLAESADSSYTGDISITGSHAWATLLNLCERSIGVGSIRTVSDSCALYPVNSSTDCYGEGSVTANCRGGYLQACGVSGTDSQYRGNIIAANIEGGSIGLAGASGENCSMEGDLLANEDASSSASPASGSGCYFSGTVKAGDVSAAGDQSFVCADVTAYRSFRAYSGYFSGNVVTQQFEMSENDCYMEGHLRIEDDDIFSLSPGSYFSGSVDLYPGVEDTQEGQSDGSPRTAYVCADVPVTVHHAVAGTWNSASLGDQDVYYHISGECQYGHSWIVVSEGDPTDDHTGHYIKAIDCSYSENPGDPDQLRDSWNGSFDPDTRLPTPQRDPASYTLQAVDESGEGLGGVFFHIGGTTYEADEFGCVELVSGPGAITPLVISSSADPEDALREIKAFYPIPDRVNRLRISYVQEPELSFTMQSEGADSGNMGKLGGFTFELFGHEITLFDLPMELDLDIEKLIKCNVTYNPDTQHYEVVFGTAKGELNEASLPNFEATRKALAKGIFPEGSRQAALIKALAVDWSMDTVGYLELELTDDAGFMIHEAKAILRMACEARYSTQLPPPVTFLYATAALSGEIDVASGVDLTPEDVAEEAILQFIATVEPSIRLEGAIGAGSRFADIYAEVGVGGQLDGTIDLPFSSAREDLELTGSADVFGEARFLIYSGRIKQTLAQVQLWPRPEKTEPTALLTAGDVDILPRDYAPQISPMSDAAGAQYASTLNGGGSDYPYMDLQLQMLPNGRYLLVYTDDDLTRQDADRSTLRAAIGAPGEGGLVWGESVTLDPDGTADLMFDVCASGDNVAVVWQDLNTTFGDGRDIDTETAAAAVELNRMLLDCSGDIPVPGEITPLSTGGDVYETMPRIFCSGSAVRTAWISSTVNDPLYAGPEEYTLWLHDGTSVSAVTTTDSPITAIAFAGNELLWTEKAQETNSLWRSDSSGSITCELSDGVRNLQSSSNSFCYTEGTALISGSGSFAGRRTVATAADYERDLRLDSLGNVRFGQAGLEHSLICQLDTGETTPVFLHEGFLSGWDMDGAYLAALVKTGLEEDDTAQLVFAQTGFPEKVSLSAIRVCDPVAAPGSDVRLQLSVYNEAGKLWDLNTSVTAADGTVLYEAVDSSGLDHGESRQLELSFPLPRDFAAQDITVTVNGTSRTIALGGRNLAVDAEWTPCDADCVNVFVTNTGTEPESGTVTLRDGDLVLWTRSVSLDAGGHTVLPAPLGKTFDVPAELTVTLEESPDAAYEADNHAIVSIEPIRARALLLTAPELSPGQQAPMGVRTWPAGSLMPEIVWSSEDPSVVTVDPDGMLHAVSAGETQISATTDRGVVFTAAVIVAEHVHSFTNYVSDNNATCTEDGTKTAKCDHCDATDTIPNAGSALGHSFGDWTVTREPTAGEEGLEERSCARCGHSEQRSIAKLENPFSDVAPGSFYYEPVMWAVENGITNGTSATTFSPGDPCMRAHVVTFLWRAVGSPEPTRTDDPFVDVKPGDFYYKPVLWALENGITSGIDATHFAPSSYCNRAQVVTFLYRSLGSPALESAENPFTDVAGGSFYERAVLWAVKNGITNGTSATTFGPGTICNRAQIVTFLYRAFAD